jgi:hypothetical protein
MCEGKMKINDCNFLHDLILFEKFSKEDKDKAFIILEIEILRNKEGMINLTSNRFKSPSFKKGIQTDKYIKLVI